MTRIRWRRGTAAEWTGADPIMLDGEPGYETDTGKLKVGDGSTSWTGLAYYAAGGGFVPDPSAEPDDRWLKTSSGALIYTGAPSGVTYGTPALTLGTANANGSTDEAIRRDATILAFDATAPSTQAFGDSAAAGAATVAARRDHKHAMPANPVSLATPAIVLGSAAAAGAAGSLIRSDSTIAAFDATSPTTQAFGDSAAVGTAAFAARRDHKHAMMANPYTDGWISTAVSLTYSSVDGATGVCTTGSDLTGVIPGGARLKFTQTTVKYFIVTAIDATTITFWGGTDYTLVNAAVSAVSWSPAKVPLGFNPDPTKWTVETNQAADAAKTTPVNGTWYGDTGLSATGPNIVIPIGAWRVYYQVYESASAATAITCTSQVSLSTSTTAVTDADLTAVLLGGVTTTARQTLFREKVLVLAAKATYYLICRTTVNSQTTIGHAGGTVPTIIRAVCAYL